MRQLDRIGIGWRPELAGDILTHLDEIDVVEVIVDNHFRASTSDLRALRTLDAQVPVVYHGVGLGLASAQPVSLTHLEKLARVFDVLKPQEWSEHLAFVRAGGVELGHLAAPPRTLHTIEGALKNLDIVSRYLGSLPVLENIATLIDPPGSKMSEPEWVGQIITRGNCDLLLDLHNLYANAVNMGQDPFHMLSQFPLNRVRMVHLSGGRWISEPKMYARYPDAHRLLDDHLHDVPEAVFDLLAHLVHLAPQPLTIFIERDGDYPAFVKLQTQLNRVRTIVAEARARSLWRVNECLGL